MFFVITRFAVQEQEIEKFYDLPFLELMDSAHYVHKSNCNPCDIECASLLSIKTGACPEDCKYCSQSGHYKTSIEREKLLPIVDVINRAKAAKKSGATRFCMGAAWRGVPKKAMPAVLEMIKEVKALGLETCVTLGTLETHQAEALKNAGLDYYNHNLDTSRDYYPSVITTRTYDDRLVTIQRVRDAGINVCCGGILGLGESSEDRIKLIAELSEMQPCPQSVPINRLVPMKGTPLENVESIDDIEFVKIIAVTRLAMPKTVIRLSAGRESMSELMQALCFYVGANSVFFGEKLLTAQNFAENDDLKMFAKLGLKASELVESACSV